MKDVVIGLDIGTSSVKAAGFDLTGRLLGKARAPIVLHSPAPGWAEQEPVDWWNAVCNVLTETLKEFLPGRVAALGRLGAFASPRRIELAARLFTRLSPPIEGPPSEGAMRIDVTGEKGGREETLTLCGTGTMRDATGIALSIGAQLLGAGKVEADQGGVYGPEGCFDPEDFLRMMSESGITAYSDLSMKERIN